MLGVNVELLRNETTLLVARFEGVEKDLDSGLIDLFAAAHKHVFIILEGDVGDHLDVLGTLLKLLGQGLNLLDAHADVPDGLVEGNHGLLAVFRSVFVELTLLGIKLTDLLGEEVLVEDLVTDEGAPELGGLSKAIDGVNDSGWVGSTRSGEVTEIFGLGLKLLHLLELLVELCSGFLIVFLELAKECVASASAGD